MASLTVDRNRAVFMPEHDSSGKGWVWEVLVNGSRQAGVIQDIGQDDLKIMCESMLSAAEDLSELEPELCHQLVGGTFDREPCRKIGIVRCPVRGFAVCPAHIYLPLEGDELPMHCERDFDNKDSWACSVPEFAADASYWMWFQYEWRCDECLAAAVARVEAHADDDYYQRFGLGGDPIRVKLSWLITRAENWRLWQSEMPEG